MTTEEVKVKVVEVTTLAVTVAAAVDVVAVAKVTSHGTTNDHEVAQEVVNQMVSVDRIIEAMTEWPAEDQNIKKILIS